MSARRGLTFVALGLLIASGTPALAQDAVPPPGGIVRPERAFALAATVGALRWDEEAPWEDGALAGLAIERALWRGIRGRAAFAFGGTTLAARPSDFPPILPPAPGDDVDAWVYSIDLQAVLGADFGPFRTAGIVPFAVGGVGSLVTNPSGDGGVDLPTRSQTQVTYGGGVRARLGSRWEAVAEATAATVRLADPYDATNNETTTIHNLRWEGRLQWVF